MRTTVDLPDDLFRRAKSEAALRGISLQQLVGEALVLALDRQGSLVLEHRDAYDPGSGVPLELSRRMRSAVRAGLYRDEIEVVSAGLRTLFGLEHDGSAMTPRPKADKLRLLPSRGRPLPILSNAQVERLLAEGEGRSGA